jgi:hypothetical protein
MNKQSPDIDRKISYGLKNRDKLPRVARGNKKTDDKLVFSEINGENLHKGACSCCVTSNA